MYSTRGFIRRQREPALRHTHVRQSESGALKWSTHGPSAIAPRKGRSAHRTERPRVCVGWGQSDQQAAFERALKTLSPNRPLVEGEAPPAYPPYVPLNFALAKAFHLLGAYRLQNGAETLGQGRRMTEIAFVEYIHPINPK